MGEYKRYISYIYSYIDGVKNNNCGFARIEQRDGICKINIMLRIEEQIAANENVVYEIYFFRRNKSGIQKMFFDNMEIKNNVGEIKKRVTTEWIFRDVIEQPDINVEDISIEKIAGIYLCRKNSGSINKMDIIFASEWDDKGINVKDFKENDDKIVKDNILRSDKGLGYNIGNIWKNEEKIRDMDEQSDNKSNDKGHNQSDNHSEALDERLDEKLSENLDENLNQKFDEKQSDQRFEQQLEMYGRGPLIGDYFHMLSRCYPKFKINGINNCESIKITPHDISYLPKKYWDLSNNSFLLHGYYSYRYILLCKKSDDEKSTYFLGIPGLFQTKEEKIAKMFGFTEFMREYKPESSDKGYWCMYL